METQQNFSIDSSNNQVTKKKPHILMSILIGVAIAVLSVMFYFYSFDQIFQGTKDDPSVIQRGYDTCNQKYGYSNEIYKKNDCLSEGGIWNDFPAGQVSRTVLVDGEEVAITGSCDSSHLYNQCVQDLNKNNPRPYANDNLYEVKKFFGALALGIILVIISMFIRDVLAVSIGLAIAGITLTLSGVVHFWSDISGLGRVAILGLGLATIIFIAIKKFRN